MKNYFNHNGKIIDVLHPSPSILNRQYHADDGLIETMKMVNGKINLIELHFERLFYSMQVLGFRAPVLFSKEKLNQEIRQLAEKNNCSLLARIRLTVFMDVAGPQNGLDNMIYTIECMSLDESGVRWNARGLRVDVFPGAEIVCNRLSNLKTTSRKSYNLAAGFARENKLDDALLLNQYGRICESTIANIFWVKDGIIFTPPLTEGCIAGLVRNYLLQKTNAAGYTLLEKPLTKEELTQASELFFTNAVKGLRWVSRLGDKKFENKIGVNIFNQLIAPIWH